MKSDFVSWPPADSESNPWRDLQIGLGISSDGGILLQTCLLLISNGSDRCDQQLTKVEDVLSKPRIRTAWASIPNLFDEKQKIIDSKGEYFDYEILW